MWGWSTRLDSEEGSRGKEASQRGGGADGSSSSRSRVRRERSVEGRGKTPPGWEKHLQTDGCSTVVLYYSTTVQIYIDIHAYSITSVHFKFASLPVSLLPIRAHENMRTIIFMKAFQCLVFSFRDSARLKLLEDHLRKHSYQHSIRWIDWRNLDEDICAGIPSAMSANT